MASSELRIDDDYVTSMGSTISEWAGDLQKGVDSYVGILNAIVEDSIMEGDTAEALKSFISYAENMKEMIRPIGEDAHGMCAHFLAEVDEADSFLY